MTLLASSCTPTTEIAVSVASMPASFGTTDISRYSVLGAAHRTAAEQCRLAWSTANALDKIVLVSMARAWDRLADNATIRCHDDLVTVEGGMKP
jgi:hypothetical protein